LKSQFKIHVYDFSPAAQSNINKKDKERKAWNSTRVVKKILWAIAAKKLSLELHLRKFNYAQNQQSIRIVSHLNNKP
jgi:hypothetical protein